MSGVASCLDGIPNILNYSVLSYSSCVCCLYSSWYGIIVTIHLSSILFCCYLNIMLILRVSGISKQVLKIIK